MLRSLLLWQMQNISKVKSSNLLEFTPNFYLMAGEANYGVHMSLSMTKLKLEPKNGHRVLRNKNSTIKHIIRIPA